MSHAAAFGIAAGLGACLLFQIQFVLAKQILPWFGGAAVVWSTSLVVFQALLLAGYAYAHALTHMPSRRDQVNRHLALMGGVLALLAWRALAWPSPVTPGEAWRPDADASPVPQIIALLASAVGLPAAVLASTTPLLLRWSADPTRGRLPYRLYAVSNLGSIMGLVSYPLLIEPWLDVFQQGRWWTAGYAVYAAAVVMCARADPDRRTSPVATPGPPHPDRDRRTSTAAPTDAEPSRSDHAMWLLLAAVPSALLQATTTRITQDVAAVPFLWMLPLAIYLLTFVAAFELRRWYQRDVLAILVALCTLAATQEWSTGVMLAALLAMLAGAGLSLHGELAARAPAPRWATRFLLVVAAGGVLGSALAAFVPPLVFASIVEYPLTLACTVFALAVVYARAARNIAPRQGRRAACAVAAAYVLLGIALCGRAVADARGQRTDTIYMSRNFFGSLRVQESTTSDGARSRSLLHGTTLHGMQLLDPAGSRRALSYFGPRSGIARALTALSGSSRRLHVGVLGLGAGTLATFGRPGDVFTFFEIDPDVVALSAGPAPLFRYLRDSRARTTTVVGDARLALERAAPCGFDLLAMDAFSSDSVPVHLLTREAFALYARHLRSPRSLLAVQITNRYLDLAGVVQASSAPAGFTSVVVTQPDDEADTRANEWMLLARDPAALLPFGRPYHGNGTAAWTDASSNLLGLVRW